MHAPRTLSVVALILFLSACSTFGGGEPDISGDYETQVMVEGETIPVALTLVKTEQGTYTGGVDAAVVAPLRITSVTQAGDGWTIRASGPDGSLTMTMYLDGDSVSGTWGFADMGGRFTGTKVRD